MALHLDHIIVLLPYSSLINLPQWITENFTITPGGVHADGKTENKLICFRDGSYIELISFINDDPKKREGHWWGEKKPGIIDLALTSRSAHAAVSFAQLQDRLRNLDLEGGAPKVEYQPPVSGGRQRPDGVNVKWDVTFPIVNTGYQRGELPFFCHDITPREVRVPLEERNTTHPNGAHGVNELYIYSTEDRVSALAEAFSAILGVPNTVSESDPNFLGSFELERFQEFEGVEKTVLVVGLPMEEEQQQALEERGGLLLGGLTVGSADGENDLLVKLDVDEGGIGGFIAPVVHT